MAQDLFIVAIDLGGFTVPALMTYSEDRWRPRTPLEGEPAGGLDAAGVTEAVE